MRVWVMVVFYLNGMCIIGTEKTNQGLFAITIVV
jgi:hypothetical protein